MLFLQYFALSIFSFHTKVINQLSFHPHITLQSELVKDNMLDVDRSESFEVKKKRLLVLTWSKLSPGWILCFQLILGNLEPENRNCNHTGNLLKSRHCFLPAHFLLVILYLFIVGVDDSLLIFDLLRQFDHVVGSSLHKTQQWVIVNIGIETAER